MHIQNTRIRNWVRHRLESRPPKRETPRDVAGRAAARAARSGDLSRRFLHTRYVGQKRFSLQGAESLMVILDTILHKCPGDGVEEICMGMAHRGRLNVLANFLRKSLKVIFTEFTENYIPDLVAGDGDVKYHLGYRTVRKLDAGAEVEIRLAANPSHLEAVDPVVEGTARARQRIRGDTEHRRKVLPLLIHGDAAFAGQGIVAETLNMSQLPGYGTGGTVHVVVNNQIGFTTLPEDARSSMYCTDIAKMIEAPIFHVNGDDPLAVMLVTELALDFRQEFGRDVVIDMYCYRRYGHNEGDEPSFTQPDLYAQIDKRPSVAQLYKQELLEAGSAERGRRGVARDGIRGAARDGAGRGEGAEKRRPDDAGAGSRNRPRSFSRDTRAQSVATAISEKMLQTDCRWPDECAGRFQRSAEDQAHRARSSARGFRRGRALRLALCRGARLRLAAARRHPGPLSGQDSRAAPSAPARGSLRRENREAVHPADAPRAEKQARICIYNSLLSEAAVLGFDYGYSLDYPNMLCLWEAQFGDFANGAQTIIDQFIVSAESKWQRPSGIVLLLAARLRRPGAGAFQRPARAFPPALRRGQYPGLQPDDAAQYFHVLRRQMKRDFRQAAHHHDAEEPAARGVRVFARGRFHQRPFRGNSGRPKARRRRKDRSASSFAPAKSITTC